MNMIVEDAIRDLLTPEAVRERCLDILNVGEANGLEHFNVNQENFDFAVELVLKEMSKKGVYRSVVNTLNSINTVSYTHLRSPRDS